METHKTKAETLSWLAGQGFPVPELLCFSVESWEHAPETIMRSLHDSFGRSAPKVAVRSSAQAEDGSESSQAGAFRSILHVPSDNVAGLCRAICAVKDTLHNRQDQIFVQRMVGNVIMSGVLMTRHLDDGSPYYVINYDDRSGRTDTVTGGIGASKTVCIYRGARDDDFDSPRLRAVINLARSLEKLYAEAPLDIEFALDARLNAHLLQVRRICASRHWKAGVEEQVSSRIRHVESFVRHIMAPRFGLYGKRTILGVMPDWNPAEILGIAPRPLASSLYRELITRRTWSLAREQMGYAPLPPVELMITVAGRPYIDVRASFNSFLPAGLRADICEKLANAWLDRLDSHPNLHDKVEFDVVHTVAVPDMEQSFTERYPGLLSTEEFATYRAKLLQLTNAALASQGTLTDALDTIEKLRDAQEARLPAEAAAARDMDAFDLALRMSSALEQCIVLGTIPFATAARHAFIAESLLRSMTDSAALELERVAAFKQSIRTVSGELTRDFQSVCAGLRDRESFLQQYGHLRPGTYDILSPSYAERDDLFAASAIKTQRTTCAYFQLSSAEQKAVNGLLQAHGLLTDAERFLDYARRAIAGREYAKFIFTRHIAHIMTLLTAWGDHFGLGREELSMLTINEVLDSLTKPFHKDSGRYFQERVRQARQEYDLMRSFKLAYLIRSPRDVYIVPQHRSVPNFITAGRVQAPVAHLEQHHNSALCLEGRIVCIESADPGYDWIFTRHIAGLITRYGGSNSHMAIRCAEYALPAAIGCGEVLFERIRNANSCLLDCAAKSITPLDAPDGAAR